MCRKLLLQQTSSVLETMGFKQGSSKDIFTYQYNVKYPSIFEGKNDHAHFVLYTPHGTVQLVVKFQESPGTAMEKLGYTVMDAARTEHTRYVVVCGGSELMKHNCAIHFLNDRKFIASRLHALYVNDLSEYLKQFMLPEAA
ncbi:PD-(D/E)XK nuclease superfamily protein [Photobacterium angustum]|uniref:PD-(D/E)XK nuclease superfamily protein n=1 Tax=Photobacterium angustum TaxID=661 RepID=UPI0005DCA5AB|nr:PD-(D/E)XK nuclease superfamily protein [Photobacterium angustum]KJF92521.1 hypothetical protein UB39_20090 [Photobacterium angustum]PSW77103.1 hypothetical protein CTN03_21035 [Photobacterium angustum]